MMAYSQDGLVLLSNYLSGVRASINDGFAHHCSVLADMNALRNLLQKLALKLDGN
jgi:hypothetical protein